MLPAANLERESSGQEMEPQFAPSSPASFLQAYLRKFLQPPPTTTQTAPSTGDPVFKHIDLGVTLSAPMGYYLLKPVVT